MGESLLGELYERGDEPFLRAPPARRERTHERLAEGADERGGDSPRVVRAELPARDAVVEDAGEGVAIAGAQAEPLGLDGTSSSR
jgi:hypothetical protein